VALIRDLPSVTVIATTNPPATDPDVAIAFQAVRAPDDAASIGGAGDLPGLTPAGQNTATLVLNQTGSFQILAYIDTNGNGMRDTGETGWALPLAIVQASLPPGSAGSGVGNNMSMGYPGNISSMRIPSDTTSAWTSSALHTGAVPFNIDASPPTSAVYLQAEIYAVGGGNDGSRGIDRFNAGWVLQTLYWLGNAPAVVLVNAPVTQNFTATPKATVFLVPGIGNSSFDMQFLAGELAATCTGVVQTKFFVDAGFDYSRCAQGGPSCNVGVAITSPTFCSIANGGQSLAQYIRTWSAPGFPNQVGPPGSIVLIGHSMGGLMARDVIAKNELAGGPSVAGLITLGTPSLGYPFQPADGEVQCPQLIADMAGSWFTGTSNPVPPISPFLGVLATNWPAASYGGCWLPPGRRAIFQIRPERVLGTRQSAARSRIRIVTASYALVAQPTRERFRANRPRQPRACPAPLGKIPSNSILTIFWPADGAHNTRSGGEPGGLVRDLSNCTRQHPTASDYGGHRWILDELLVTWRYTSRPSP
jgi:pimeloyl-ACP methyl ester carboxylesterase